MTMDAYIWQSALNIFQSRENLKKLFDALDLIECQTPGLALDFEEWDDSETDFIQPVWNAYYSVKRSKRRNAKVEGWVTLAIQLTCNEGVEADWDFGKRAKVFVGYSPERSKEYKWEFDFESPNTAGYCEDCAVRDSHWVFKGEGKVGWFYALPLDQMTSTEAVKKLVVAPLHEILQSSDPQNPTDVLRPLENYLCLPPNPSSVRI